MAIFFMMIPLLFTILILLPYACLAVATVARVPPRPILSIADEGTMTIEPLSRMDS